MATYGSDSPKYHAARLPNAVITRRAALNVLHENIDRKLVVIAAGPGYGKSTLLAQFAGEVEFPVCWITLNPWDADLATFVADLCQTLSQRFPEFGADLESALATYQGLGDDIQRLAAKFVKELESNAEDYFMLVVDDFHQVEESEAVTGFLDLVVPNLPDHCHLVISSRSVPRIRELRRLT